MTSPALRKCFELSGVVPLGVYLVVHVAAYARVTFGATRFGVTEGSSAVELALECLLVWLPLAFHAGYGLHASFSPIEEAPPGRARRIALRVSGWVSLAFLIQHAVWLRWPLASGALAPDDVHELMAAALSSTVDGVPLVAAVHLAGLGVVCAHFAWGFARFLERWRIAGARPARLGAGALALSLFIAGASAIVELATGSALPRFA